MKFNVIDNKKTLDKYVAEVKKEFETALKEKQYFQRRIEITEEMLPKLEQALNLDASGHGTSYRDADENVYKGCETVLIYNVEFYCSCERGQTKLVAIHNYSTDAFDYVKVIKADGMYLMPYKMSGTKNYSFCHKGCSAITDKWGNGTYADYLPQEPSKVGTMTPKKLADWVSYFKEVDRICAEKEQESINKVAAFKQHLKTLGIACEGDNGDEIRNGLKYHWSIDKYGHITSGIDLEYVFDDTMSKAERFVRMADNKL